MTHTTRTAEPAALACGCTRAHKCAHAEKLAAKIDRARTPAGRTRAARTYLIHREAVNPTFRRALDVVGGRRA